MNKELDKQICELKGIVPCNNWIPHSYGIQPSFIKACEHENCAPITFYPWPYSSDIKTAWELFEEAKKSTFSKRIRYFEMLGQLLDHSLSWDDGVKVKWPDALVFLSPEFIAQAYVKWKAEIPAFPVSSKINPLLLMRQIPRDE